jgi:hypothetical protein
MKNRLLHIAIFQERLHINKTAGGLPGDRTLLDAENNRRLVAVLNPSTGYPHAIIFLFFFPLILSGARENLKVLRLPRRPEHYV